MNFFFGGGFIPCSAVSDNTVDFVMVCSLAEFHVQFAQFDKDGDGRITREEFMSVMRSLGYTVDADEVDGMLRAADTDSK